MSAKEIPELSEFINRWTESPNQAKKAFMQLVDHMENKEEVEFEFVPREGLTYSLRLKHPNQKSKPLFGMIDVIEDNPRWLSVAFYGEMINDPEEKGDMVPEGLMGEDAHTFDLYEYDESEVSYIAERLDEAVKNAAKG